MRAIVRAAASFSSMGMYDTEALVQDIGLRGWTKFNLEEATDDILEKSILTLASALGRIDPGRGGQLIERIVPLIEERAHQSSLSRRYGIHDFPFHNDTAHRVLPTRYVILVCAQPGSVDVPTWLLDTSLIKFTMEQLNYLRSSVFFVRNGRKSFYSSMLPEHCRFYRVDPGCMEPINKEAELALDIFAPESVEAYAQKISWKRGTVVAFDNWRVLHRRGSGATESSKRVLYRCSAV